MDTTKKELVPHPGEYLREEIKERGWNQRDLAFILGCPEQSVNLILAEKRGVSPDMAKSLGEAFDVSPELFINLQRAYDLVHAKEPKPGIAKRAHICSIYPIREMIKRGWISAKSYTEIENELARFFNVQDINDIPHLAHIEARHVPSHPNAKH